MLPTAPSTIDPADIARFNAIAAEWWDPRGKFRPLHQLNPVRLSWIRDTACRHLGRDPASPQPLAGLRALDVGCGGGLLSEPLARLGAQVLGIDAAAGNIRTAQAHAAQSGLPVDYRAVPAESLAAAGEQFDLVVAMEIVEHVADIALFTRALAQLVKPGGLLLMSTLNRTRKSWLLAIAGAEYVLNWVPRGTHDWNKFLKPSELAGALRQAGLQTHELTGLVYNPLSGRFRTEPRDLDVNYLLAARR